MDQPFAGDERQHRSWRDLPPTPPLVWPSASPYAAAATGVASAPVPAPSRVRRPGRRLVVATTVLAVAIIVVASGLLAGGNQLAALLAPVLAGGPAGSDRTGSLLAPNDESLADTASRLLPSVVQIEAGGAVGSGFVAADGGLILTASHVVGGSDTVTLTLHDGATVSGTVVAVDKSIDTAVVRAEDGPATQLPPLVLGALADVEVGETTIAIGSPFGLSQTVTTGIVSALGRTVPTPIGELHDLIQTDAAINSGNSGGPLTDGQGRAIGINTAIASASGGSDGIGFAVPVDQAVSILDKVQDGTWAPEDNDPADDLDPLGGLFDQFLGPDALDGLGELFGLGPGGPTTPDDPTGGSDAGDRLLRALLDELMRELAPDATNPEPAPDTEPDTEPAPAPGDADDPAADSVDRLMQQLFDEMLRGLSPGGMLDPFAPEGDADSQGAQP